jgi:FkbM family methyltransferase
VVGTKRGHDLRSDYRNRRQYWNLHYFFDALTKRYPSPRLKKVVCFEPSLEAFRRLLKNLEANNAKSVNAFNAAIGPCSGLRNFFEPNGHLTNGSFLREFSTIFSDSVYENVAVVVGAAELDRYLTHAPKALIKIDVEGFESELIYSLEPLISKYHPDILIEVLPSVSKKLEQNRALVGFDRFLITPKGLEKAPLLFACGDHRDWLLRWQG